MPGCWIVRVAHRSRHPALPPQERFMSMRSLSQWLPGCGEELRISECRGVNVTDSVIVSLSCDTLMSVLGPMVPSIFRLFS